MTPSTLLRGSRVRLTALTQSDLPTVIQWHQNPEFYDYLTRSLLILKLRQRWLSG